MAEKLADYTTLKVGGLANIVHAKSEDEIIKAIREAGNKEVLILGGGSNLLIGDDGFAGVVIKIENTGNSYEIDACSGGLLTVAAGEDWDQFVKFTMDKGLANLESLSGIPGTVGATPIQNIGAYGHEVSEVIARVRTFDRKINEIKTLMASELDFGYRNSKFKREPNRYVILDVTFHLRRGETSLPIKYEELAKALNVEIESRVPITQVREAVLKLRESKGMLANSGINSAGSFFMNPVISKEDAALLPSDAPRWQQADGAIKTSAAWLIEQAGFTKGYSRGNAGISSKHVLALVNNGGASAMSIVELAMDIRDAVRNKFDIVLQPEVQLSGIKFI
jgi:UDP-N-acetylmuramate dehydrogenase